MDRRREPRFHVRFDALFSSGRREGAGQLADLSCSGARIEGVSIRPPVGTPVRIYVFVQPVAPFQLAGRVVRETETGFAIEYEIDDAVRRLVEDAAAVVAVPAQAP
jgi:hypothetical protein